MTTRKKSEKRDFSDDKNDYELRRELPLEPCFIFNLPKLKKRRKKLDYEKIKAWR